MGKERESARKKERLRRIGSGNHLIPKILMAALNVRLHSIPFRSSSLSGAPAFRSAHRPDLSSQVSL